MKNKDFFISITTEHRGRIKAIEKTPIIEQVPADKFVEKTHHGTSHSKDTGSASDTDH